MKSDFNFALPINKRGQTVFYHFFLTAETITLFQNLT